MNTDSINFYESVFDVGNTVYAYRDGNIFSSDEDIPIKDFINAAGELSYVSIPTIERSYFSDVSVLKEIASYQAEFDDMITKLEHFVMIIVADEKDILNEGLIENDFIVGDYTIDDFALEFDYPEELPVSITKVKKRFIQTNSETVLSYIVDYHGNRNFFGRKDQIIYNKSVRVSDAMVTIPFMVGGLYIDGMAINVNDSDIVPNVSRNNFNSDDMNEISYAIGKAIHLWILENKESVYDIGKIELVKKFIDQFYSRNCRFVK